MKIAVYPGTFDPVTNGHLDILERSLKIFDKVILGVAEETYKTNLFTFEERIKLLKMTTKEFKNVEVEGFEGLLMEYVKSKKAVAIIRGLRAISDFEYEFQLSLMNKKLDGDVETVFFMTTAENAFISSSMIKQVSSLDGSVKGLVPDVVLKALEEKYSQKEI